MMNKRLEQAIILGLILTGFNSFVYAAEDINGNNSSGNVNVGSNEEYGQVSGYYQKNETNDIVINGENTVYVEGKAYEINGIYGWSDGEISSVKVSVSGGTVKLENGTVESVQDGSGSKGGNINGNFAYSADKEATAKNGTVIINNGTVGAGKGTVYGVNGSFAWSDRGSAVAEGGQVTISGNSEVNFLSVPNNTYRGIIGSQAFTNEWGDSKADATAINGRVTISGGTIDGATYVLGNLAYTNNNTGGEAYAENGHVIINEDTGTTVINNSIRGSYTRSTTGDSVAKNSTVEIHAGTINGDIYGGYSLVNKYGNIDVSGNQVQVLGGTVTSNVIVGGYGGHFGTAGQSMIIQDNKIILGGEATVQGSVIGAYFRLPNFTPDSDFESVVKDNTITVTGNVNLQDADLYGAYISGVNTIKENSGNDLIIDNWKGQQVNSLNNFNNIKFQNIDWENEGIVVEVLNNNATTSLENTMIDLRNSTTLSGGVSLKENDYMYFIKSANGSIGTNENNILVNQDGESDNIFTAGVALEGTGKVEVEADGSVKYTITDVNNTEQIDIVPVNSSLAAAFVINGNDLVVDGLNAMEQDQLFGVKTFAIVEGHDSSYDVADDLKVNGWNGLYGVGNIKEYKDGNLSYAAFFENGTANYRTFNSFMDEVIRGDGSIVYNGGGIAGRYKKNDGFYTEASLRAGLLKNELKNMFKDGNGSIYGYKTESPYYAFHLGIGKVIVIEEDRNIDLYARYYHTYNDGDNFTVAGDRFEVDSINSDKVRIGTRYNVNNDKDISTYYGLAWEYEFNGDADVSVNGQKLPGETLQGSSGFAEIGFVQRNSSPWSFEGRVRGYVGEREGVSGLLRATYSF